jgi:L-lactate permease
VANMTSKQRHLVYEAIAMSVAGILGAFSVPMMLNERNSVSVVTAGLLILGWVIWVAYFIYRASKH